MVSDEELLRWAEKYYPEFKHNLDLIRMLYERLHSRGVDVGYKGYVEKKIADVQVGDYVEVIGVVARFVRAYKYEGCKICFRKACNEHNERGTITMNAYEIGDDTGFIRIVMPRKADDGLELKVGQVVCVRGRVNEWNGIIEIVVHEWDLIRDVPETEESMTEAVEQITSEDDREKRIFELLSKLKITKDMKKDVFVRYIKRKGFTWDDFKDLVRIEVRDGDEWVVFD